MLKTTSPSWISDGSPIDDPHGYGERAVTFLRNLRHPKSRKPGRAFDLPAWMERIVRRIYGPCDANGRRIVRNVVILLPRGNRKTTLGAALALLHTIGPERLPGGQVICAAADRKQARIAYEEARDCVAQDTRLRPLVRFQDSQNRMIHNGSAAKLEAISCDAGTQHGRTPTFTLADELHAWKKRDLWDVLRSGMVKLPGSLLCVITTAGRGQQNIAWDIVDYARKVARGEIDDPATLPILFETPADADWRDEAVWRACNPGLANGFPDIEGLRQLAREAENRPGDREAFRQLNLNVWLDHSHDPFVDMATYDLGRDPVDLETLEDRPCYVGVDLSKTHDLTAVVAAWRDDDGGYTVKPWFFCPKDALRERADRDGVPYPQWAEEGLITATPGSTVDYHAVESRIRELCDRFSVSEIVFDRWEASGIMRRLEDDGLPVFGFGQGFQSMGAAISELERAIIGRQFQHGGHPILRWNFENVAIKSDDAGNRKFTKAKSKELIDGAVACAMAVARAHADEGGSIYNEHDRPEGLLVW